MAKKSKTTLNVSNKKVTAFLKAMAHPIRMDIVNLLLQNSQMTVSEICESLDLEQSLTSHHLANMRNSGVLASKREGKNIQYMLKSSKIEEILNIIKELVEE
ncbi:MAG: metalloregulator ArsR/SmtB family transcription factor [Raineya sp.]|nr:metalloregulator ArsR/SmtB family transcription factor [Raineya sp.]